MLVNILIYCDILYTGAYKNIFFLNIILFIKWGQHPEIIYYYNLLHFAFQFWIQGCLNNNNKKTVYLKTNKQTNKLYQLINYNSTPLIVIMIHNIIDLVYFFNQINAAYLKIFFYLYHQALFQMQY